MHVQYFPGDSRGFQGVLGASLDLSNWNYPRSGEGIGASSPGGLDGAGADRLADVWRCMDMMGD